MAWNLGHGPLPIRCGVHRRQDRPSHLLQRHNRHGYKHKTDCFSEVWMLSEELRCHTSLICVEGHQAAAGLDVVALRREGTSSHVCNPALRRNTGVSVNQWDLIMKTNLCRKTWRWSEIFNTSSLQHRQIYICVISKHLTWVTK